jgi:ArsR family transcriptional regulator
MNRSRMKDTTASRRLSRIARALGDPTRIAILERLALGERCVCDLTDELSAAQSRLSFHLRILKDAALICARPAGRMTYYALRRRSSAVLQEFLGRLDRAASRRQS